MRRTTIALLAALEAAVAVLVGLGITAVPAMLIWALRLGLDAPVDVVLRAAVDVWLIGHGVDLVVQVDPATAARVALPDAGEPFAVTIALLGFALITVAAGWRLGRRSAGAGHPLFGIFASMIVTGAAGFSLAIFATADAAQPVLWQGAALPAFATALGAVIGAVGEGSRLRRAGAGGAFIEAVDRLPEPVVDIAAAAWRIGAGTAAAVLGAAAVIVAVLVFIDYGTLAGLSQALGPGIDGGIAVTLFELALLPNVIVWAASWMLGPGFALGAGTTISPSVVLVGPVPGLPLLGALPAEPVSLGVLWLALPVVVGFAGAVVVGRRPDAPHSREWWKPLATGAAAGAVAGVVLGVCAWWSSGAAGPGRLAQVGPDPLAVGLAAAASIAVGAVAGAYASWARRRSEPVPSFADDPVVASATSGDVEARDARAPAR